MKVKLSRSGRTLKPFDKTHDVNITADWGFIMPTLCDEIVGGSKVVFQPNTFARLSPLVAPTFGRAIVKHYAYYVPLTDVQMNYEELMAGMTYNGGGHSYVPTQVFSISINRLTSILFNYGYVTCRAKQTPAGIDMPTRIDKEVVGFSDAPARAAELLANLNFPSWCSLKDAFDEDDASCLSNPFNADFVVPTTHYIFTLRLTREGRHLRKIFQGLGYQLSLNDRKDRSFLPLLAYYKGWFDMFAVKREINWQQTNAFKIIQQVSYLDAKTEQDGVDIQGFIEDLLDCYYVENPNYFTAHQNKLNYVQNTTSINYVEQGDLSNNISFKESNLVGTNNFFSVTPRIHVQNLAQKLVKFVNKNNAIGQRIAAYFAAHGLGDVDDNKDTHFVGSCSFNCDFDSVMSTSDTARDVGDKVEGSSLGEYAGSGTASGSGEKFKIHCPRTGYFIVFSTVVPRCGFIQGVAPYLDHLTRFKFFNPEFEAQVYQITDKTTVFGAEDVMLANNPEGQFGIIPLYSEYKYKENYAGGDITLRSTRASMLPYILDRWFNVNEVYPFGEAADYWVVKFGQGVIPSVNDEMRYIGRNEMYGNFNRIFQQYSDDSDDMRFANDPFILHNVFNYVVMQPMLPLKSSWDTFDDSDTMTVEKA